MLLHSVADVPFKMLVADFHHYGAIDCISCCSVAKKNVHKHYPFDMVLYFDDK